MSARHGRPRIQIRAPRKIAKADIETTWVDTLSPAVAAILARTKSSLSFEELYDASYRLVVQHHGRMLYKLLQAQLAEYMTSQVYPRIICATNDEMLAQALSSTWTDLDLALQMISDVFMYLNRAWCSENDVPRVEHAGQLIFRDKVLREPSYNSIDTVAERLYAQVCREMDLARQSKLVDRVRLRQILDIFATLPSGAPHMSDSMYTDELEDRLVAGAQAFYESEARRLLLEGASPIVVLQEMRRWLDVEESFAISYIPRPTALRIVAALEISTILAALPAVLDAPGGLSQWLETNDESALALAASVESRAVAAKRKSQYDEQLAIDQQDNGPVRRPSNNNSDELLLTRFCQRLREAQISINEMCDPVQTGAAPVEAPAGTTAVPTAANSSRGMPRQKPLEAATEWVKASIALRRKYAQLFHVVARSVVDPTEAEKTLTAIWADAVNKQPKLSQYLVLYLDDLLKKSTRMLPEIETEQALEDAMLLFEAVADRDKFANAYSLHLARRLLNNRSQSEELEQSFVAKLKSRGGYSGTQHFDGMFKDMRASRQLQQLFKKQTVASEPPLVPTRVNVLTLTMWSTFCTTERLANLPPELERARQSFHDFYVDRYQSRKLRWNMSIGSADMDMHVASGTYTVTLSLYAVAIMNLFRGDEQLTLSEIVESAGVPESEAIKQLQALTLAPRTRLLLKEPAAPAPIASGDVFRFNSKFSSPQRSVKVVTAASVTRTETQKQETESLEDLKRTRALKIDAAIVRLMKARRELGHAELVQQVTAQLAKQFKPSAAAVKQRVAVLIETEYLIRDSADPSRYIYLA